MFPWNQMSMEIEEYIHQYNMQTLQLIISVETH